MYMLKHTHQTGILKSKVFLNKNALMHSFYTSRSSGSPLSDMPRGQRLSVLLRCESSVSLITSFTCLHPTCQRTQQCHFVFVCSFRSKVCRSILMLITQQIVIKSQFRQELGFRGRGLRENQLSTLSSLAPGAMPDAWEAFFFILTLDSVAYAA